MNLRDSRRLFWSLGSSETKYTNKKKKAWDDNTHVCSTCFINDPVYIHMHKCTYYYASHLREANSEIFRSIYTPYFLVVDNKTETGL